MRCFIPNAQLFHMLKNEHYVTFINSNRVRELISCEEISNFSSKEDGFHQRRENVSLILKHVLGIFIMFTKALFMSRLPC